MTLFTVGFNPATDRILECPDFHIGGHQTAKQVARLAAGKAANVSRALALLGCDSIATGFVGGDELEFFHSQLMAVGPGRVLCRFVEVAGTTRENISILDPSRFVETHLHNRGFSVSPAECVLLRDRLLHEVRAGDVVIFAGSLCEGVGSERFVALIQACNKAGARVVVDSNGEPLKHAAQQKLWMLKPNVDELGELLGREVPNAAATVREAARELLPQVEHVVVSRGAAGVVLVTRDGAWSGMLRQKVPAIRTVGCGDHLLAGFIAELTGGRNVEAALRTALAVATARAVSMDMSEFDMGVAKTMLEQVEVEQI